MKSRINHFNFTKQSDFNEVFGDYESAYTEQERRERWVAYLGLFGPVRAKYWQDSTPCVGCIHLDVQKAWCNEVNLPCRINSETGFKMLNTACEGAGFEESEPQLELFKSI